MDALWISIAVVAMAELGDKTQVLALLLAARYQQALPVLAGIAAASVLHHGLAGLVGAAFGELIPAGGLQVAVGLAFLIMAVVTVWPGDEEEEDEPLDTGGRGAFLGTLVAFGLAEIADKTQLATVALAARYDATGWVVSGAVVGMLLANLPAVLIGRAVAERMPVKLIRWASAALFAVLGIVALVA